jgi:hypothetical protein
MLVESVNLQKVDVFQVEAFEGCIDGVEDCLTRQTAVVCVVLELGELFGIVDAAQPRIFTHIAVALCEDDELLAREVVLLDRFADDLFRYTIRVDVG